MGEGRRAVPAPAGDARLRELVGEHAVRLSLERHGGALRAIVLTGSAARDEATVVAKGGRKRVLGDAELLLLFRDGAAAPAGQELQALSGAVSSALEAAGVVCQVELCPVFESYFRSLPPSIFAYELRTCGKVLWGEDALGLIPARVGAGIPLEDAFRLLWNRIIELLGAIGAAAEGEPAPVEVSYAAAKLYLDMATSFLVFTGRYEPSYRARRARLHELADESEGCGKWPFPPVEFLDGLDRCTGWKLSGEGAPDGWDFCAEAMRHARLLIRWELVRMTGYPADAADGRLWAAWRRSQPLAGRVRGWLYAVRASGWHRSWKSWPRWVRQALRGSPRVWIYGAARELLFHLDTLPHAPDMAPAVRRRAAGWLPCRNTGPADGWKDLCRGVFANYKEFLVGTRC